MEPAVKHDIRAKKGEPGYWPRTSPGNPNIRAKKGEPGYQERNTGPGQKAMTAAAKKANAVFETAEEFTACANAYFDDCDENGKLYGKATGDYTQYYALTGYTPVYTAAGGGGGGVSSIPSSDLATLYLQYPDGKLPSGLFATLVSSYGADALSRAGLTAASGFTNQSVDGFLKVDGVRYSPAALERALTEGKLTAVQNSDGTYTVKKAG